MQETRLRSCLAHLVTEAERGVNRGIERLDRHAEEHHRAVQAAYGAQRTERLMRELARLVASLD